MFYVYMTDEDLVFSGYGPFGAVCWSDDENDAYLFSTRELAQNFINHNLEYLLEIGER